MGFFLHCTSSVAFPGEPRCTQALLMTASIEVPTRVTSVGPHSTRRNKTSCTFLSPHLGQMLHICIMMAPNHYLNQYWLIREVFWYSCEGKFTRNAQDIYSWYEFETYKFIITSISPQGQWVKLTSFPFISYLLSSHPFLRPISQNIGLSSFYSQFVASALISHLHCFNLATLYIFLQQCSGSLLAIPSCCINHSISLQSIHVTQTFIAFSSILFPFT